MPIARSSVLWAHVLTSVASTLISVVVVVLIAVGMGFRSAAGALAWLAVTGIIVLFTLAVTWVAVIAGLSAKTAEGGGAYAYPFARQPVSTSIWTALAWTFGILIVAYAVAMVTYHRKITQ